MSSVPIGLLTVRSDGTVAEYLPASADAPGVSEVVGRRLFGQVLKTADCGDLPKRFEAFRKGSVQAAAVAIRVEIERPTGPRRFLFGLIRSPLAEAVLVSVARLDHPDLPLTARLRQDAVHGTLTDMAGLRVVVANTDLWRALEMTLGRIEGGGGETLVRLGTVWGLAHAVRVESFVQRKTLRTLRELELETALEYLSASLAVIGLGRFEADLNWRHLGVVVVDHHDSPFPELLPAGTGSCRVLAGFHAGLFSYLSGRTLEAFELACTSTGASSCRFLIAGSDRIRSLRRGGGAGDRELLRRLGEELR